MYSLFWLGNQSEGSFGFVVGDDDMKIFVVTGRRARSECEGRAWQGRSLSTNIHTPRSEIAVHGSRGGANSGDVGEYGRTETSSDDKPVCFDCGLRGGSSEAASAGGALAVRGNRVINNRSHHYSPRRF